MSSFIAKHVIYSAMYYCRINNACRITTICKIIFTYREMERRDPVRDNSCTATPIATIDQAITISDKPTQVTISLSKQPPARPGPSL